MRQGLTFFRCHSIRVLHGAALVLFAAAVVTAACTTTPPGYTPPPPAPAFHTDATIKDLMLGVIDTNADVVWLSVSFVNNDQGIVETRPQNDEDWAMVRRGALALMEGTNLLKMPGRKVAQDHEVSEVPGVELEPKEMEANINKDWAGWVRHVDDLYGAVSKTLAAIEAKDADKVFELGESIEHACEGCHKAYWYPNEVIPEFKFEDLPTTGQPPAAQP